MSEPVFPFLPLFVFVPTDLIDRLSSPDCTLTAGQYRLFFALVNASWRHGRDFCGERKCSNYDHAYWEPKTQVRFAAELRLHPTNVARDLKALKAAGLVRIEGKKIYPLPSPGGGGERTCP